MRIYFSGDAGARYHPERMLGLRPHIMLTFFDIGMKNSKDARKRLRNFLERNKNNERKSRRTVIRP